MPEADFIAFERQLDGVSEQSTPLIVEALGRGLQSLQSAISVVPPQPARDRAPSGHFNTYVRGVGRLPKSAFFTKKGVARKSIKTKGATRTSEKSSQRWRMSVETEGNVVRGTLENTASYSGWVWGPKEGDPHQVPWHAETGWVSADDALEQTMGHIDAMMGYILDGILDKLAGQSAGGMNFSGGEITIT